MFSQPSNSQTPVTRVGAALALLSVATLTGCVRLGPDEVERQTPTPLPEPTRNSLPTPRPTPTYSGVALAENCTPLRLPENSYEVCASVIEDPDRAGRVIDVIGTLRSTDNRTLNIDSIDAKTTLKASPLGSSASPVITKQNDSGVYSQSFVYKLQCPAKDFAGSDRYTPGVNFVVTPDSGLGVRILAKTDPTDISALCNIPTPSPTPSLIDLSARSTRATASAGIGI